ncbi:MAG TPA: M56 family metallopeptidase, partial [Rhodothermales bacterium]|nr:M56 family metallopeptidase [Rhodothermales bacterium]
AERIGLVLVHSLWQGALVAAALAVALRLLRRATHRYAAACAALALLLLLPVLTFALLDLDRAPGVSVGVAGRASQAGVDGGLALGTEGPAVAFFVPANWVDRWLPWAVGAWACGVFVFALRLVGGLAATYRLRRQALPAAEWLRERVALLALRMGLTRAVSVAVSERVRGPVVFGWLKPVVLLPLSAVTGLTPEQLEAVLAHELAHIRRHDYLVNLVQSVAETLLFYHPAVWWISGRMRAEREDCCDDAAVATCGDAIVYARALSSLERLRPAPRFAMAATGGSLTARIRRLVGAPRTEVHLVPARTAGGLVGALAVVLLVLGARTPSANPQETARREAGPLVPADPAPQAVRPSSDLPPVATPSAEVPGAAPGSPSDTTKRRPARASGIAMPDLAPLVPSRQASPSEGATGSSPLTPRAPQLRVSEAAGGGEHAMKDGPSSTSRLHIENGIVELDGRPTQLSGTNVNISSDGTLMFYEPGAGLFVVSDRPFPGAVRAGSFEDTRLQFSAGAHSIDVRTQAARPITTAGRADAYVYHDPSYRSTGSGGQGWMGASDGVPGRARVSSPRRPRG